MLISGADVDKFWIAGLIVCFQKLLQVSFNLVKFHRSTLHAANIWVGIVSTFPSNFIPPHPTSFESLQPPHVQPNLRGIDLSTFILQNITWWLGCQEEIYWYAYYVSDTWIFSLDYFSWLRIKLVFFAFWASAGVLYIKPWKMSSVAYI